MWASNEAAKKAGNRTHIAIRIDNLRFDEGSDDQSRVDLMVKSLTGAGFAKRIDLASALGERRIKESGFATKQSRSWR